jgi:hypothetical protein
MTSVLDDEAFEYLDQWQRVISEETKPLKRTIILPNRACRADECINAVHMDHEDHEEQWTTLFITS